jgi:hypothetical protein
MTGIMNAARAQTLEIFKFFAHDFNERSSSIRRRARRPCRMAVEQCWENCSGVLT